MELSSYGTLRHHSPIQSSSFFRYFDYKKDMLNYTVF
jgi:hypothetical protein